MIRNAPAIHFDSSEAWRNWLEQHGQTETDIWVGFYKKDSKKTGLGYVPAVEEALCFGWIDGLTKRVDADSYKIRFTPRKVKSNWSAYNVERVTRLLAEGKMTPAGMIHVKAAKADGRWTASS